MASVYKKRNIIYLTWFDPFEQKNKNRSLELQYNTENLRKAKQFAKQFQSNLDLEKDKFNSLGLVHDKLEKAITHFYKNNSGKDPKTIEEYKWFFNKFTKRFSQLDSCTLINKISCEDWLTSLRHTGYANNTLYKLSKVLKKFIGFLFEYNYVPMFRLNKDVTFRMEVKPIIIFSNPDLQCLIDGLENKNSNFRTTIYLLLYTGLRPSDIYEITVKDIDLSNNIISYYSPKTDDYFRVPIHPNLIPILMQRIDEVKEGKILNYESIANIGKAFRRYLKDQKLIGKEYTLRTFRKTFISLAHANGMDLATVSKLAGHKKITTTEKYYNKLSLEKQSLELIKLKFPIKTII